MKPAAIRPTTTSGPLLLLALAIAVFLVAVTLPYAWLIEHFGYDDILREPAAVILGNFRRGGAPLVAAWFGFAMASLLFIPVALGFQRLLAVHAVDDRGVATLGVASAIVQAIGLLRWVLVMPALAASFADASSTPATREAVLVVFDTVHRYGGMVIGEMVGQLLLAGWTGGVALQIWRSRALPHWLAAAGALTLPLWLLGQTELLHAVLPLPRIEVIPVAFMAWEAWLTAMAVALLARAWRQRQGREATEIPTLAT